MLIFGMPVIWIVLFVASLIVGIVSKAYWSFRKPPIDHTSALSESWRANPGEDLWR